MIRAPILGGAFGLEIPSSPCRPPFEGANIQYFLSVRCALSALVEVLRPRTAWLPAYLCLALLEPFRSAGIEIRYYGVDERLRVDDCGWVDEIQPRDIVIVIHYFGMPNSTFPAELVKHKGGYLIEDASQALFLPQQFPESVCILYSPRKYLGVPDSGVMVSNRETGTESVSLEAPPLEWWASAVDVTLRRRDFDLTGQPGDWFANFQRVESEFPVGLFRASDLSRMLISAVDYAAIRTRRRANYQKLLELAGDYAVFPELGSDVVPLGFPVRVDRGIRDRVLRRLHPVKIYSPVHWRIGGVVPPSFRASHAVSLSSITLLCDQRCTPSDMERQAGEFLAGVSEARHASRSMAKTMRFGAPLISWPQLDDV